MKPWVVGILVVAAIGVSISYTYFSTPRAKTAFVYNQTVFAKFEGKLHLEGKLTNERENNKQYLDSILSLVKAGRQDLTSLYQEQTQRFSIEEIQLSEQYTAEIWKFINEGVKEYGSIHDYDFIFGATGDGSLMYAREQNDITDEVVVYLNNKYVGK